MKKTMMLFSGVLLMAVFSHASDNFAGDKTHFWEALGKKIEGITPKERPPATNAIGGVRGEKYRAVEDLYWKGEEIGTEVPEYELVDFKNALKLVEEDKIQQAGEAFEQFIEEYPKSRLNEDARQAVEVLEAEKGESGTGF